MTAAQRAASAQRALEELDRAHRRGLEPQVRSTSRRSRGRASSSWADGARRRRRDHPLRSQRAHVDAADRSQTSSPPTRPAIAAARPMRPRLASPASHSICPTLYSIDGWFGDAYVDLIPDRTETTSSSAARPTPWRGAHRGAAGPRDYRRHAAARAHRRRGPRSAPREPQPS